MPTKVKISERGSLTLPKSLRQALGLKGESVLVVEPVPDGILLKAEKTFRVEIYSDDRIAEFEKNNNEAIHAFFPDRRR